MQPVNNQYTFNRLIDAQSNLAKANSQNRWGIAKRVTGASLVVLGIVGAAALVTVHFILPPVGISLLIGAGVASALTALIGLGLCIKGHYSSLSARRNIQMLESDVSKYKTAFQKNQSSNVPVTRPAGKIFQNVSSTINKIAAPSVSAETKKYDAWIASCGQSSIINYQKVIDFKARKAMCDVALNTARKENQSEQKQTEIFQAMMGLKNVTAADFKKYNEWLTLDSPPEEFKDDDILSSAVCMFNLTYPETPVTEPKGKCVAYEKEMILAQIKAKGTSPKTFEKLTPSDLIDLPELPAIIQCRLFDLAFPQK